MAAGSGTLVPFAQPLVPLPGKVSDLPPSGLPAPVIPSGIAGYSEPYTTAGTPTASGTGTAVAPNVQDTLSLTPPAVVPAGTGAGTPNAVNAYSPSVNNPALLPVWASGTTYALNAVVGRVAATSVKELYCSVGQSKTAVAAYASGTSYSYEDCVIGTDNNVYFSLVNSNEGNTPQSSPTDWMQVYTTWTSEISWAVGNRVLLDNILYECVSTVTTNAPDKDSTDWGSAISITANPWLIGSTYASGNYVVYNGFLFKSLQSSNTGNYPNLPDSAYWVYIPTLKWSSELDYVATQVVFHLGKYYTCQTSKNPIRTNPKMSNQLMDVNDQPATLLWNVISAGPVEAYIALVGSNTSHVPENTVGTDWAIVTPGAGYLARENARVFPPLLNLAGFEVEPWETSEFYSGTNTFSPTTRTDFGDVASLAILTPAATLNALSAGGTGTVDILVAAKNVNGLIIPIGLAGVLTGVITADTLSGECTLAQTDQNIFTLTSAGTGGSADTVTVEIGNGVKTVSVTVTLAA